jgi:predicted DNA-binding protein YlxM (UPF0122 family)
MRVSLERVVHHIAVSLAKLRAYILYYLIGDMMNGSIHRFERLGIEMTAGNYRQISPSMYNKIRSIMLSTKDNPRHSDVLTREQYEVMCLFCGFYGAKKHSVDEIAELQGLTRITIVHTIQKAIGNLNEFIINKIYDVDDVRMCAARDCVNQFTTKNNTRTYCSADCRNREKERRYRDRLKKEKEQAKPSIKCKGCGMDFVPITCEEYHNDQCRRAARWERNRSTFKYGDYKQAQG